MVKNLASTCGLMTEQSPISVPKNGKKLVVSLGITDDPNLPIHLNVKLDNPNPELQNVTDPADISV